LIRSAAGDFRGPALDGTEQPTQIIHLRALQ
jgi:hypothetical protein